MSRLFDELKEGLEQAIAMERGEASGKKTILEIIPVKRYSGKDVQRIRKRNGMTQKVFSAYLGVSQKAVEFWEQGLSRPNGAACRLMSLMEDGKSPLPFLKKDGH